MKAAVLISQVLAEAADFGHKKIGVELEFLVRRDLQSGAFGDPNGPELGVKLYALADQLGFSLKDDGSVRPHRQNSFEGFYDSLEAASSDGGEPWETMAPKLEQLLAWLKRSDVVMFLRGKQETIQLAREPVPENYKVLKLPRARIPANFSAGLHLHFDAADWFDDVAHADAFLRYWNSFQGELPSYLPAGRYASKSGTSRANYYASVQDPLNVPYDAELDLPPDRSDPMWDRMVSAVDYLKQSAGVRYAALNTRGVGVRGDIEFRFAHGTLNFETISGWLRLLAEFIEFSKDYSLVRNSAQGGIPLQSPPAVRSKFDDYLRREAPDSARFATRSRQASRRSKDPLAIQTALPRSTKRLFKLRRPPSVLHPTYAEWYGSTLGSDSR